MICWAIGDEDGASAGGILIGAGDWRGCLVYIFEGIVALHVWDRDTVVALALGGGIGRVKGHCREDGTRVLQFLY